MNVTHAIARILKQEGVEWATCFPTNNLIEAGAKEGIHPVSFRHERGAGMAADGYCRLRDRLKFAVFLIQRQAGAENAMGALNQADINKDQVVDIGLAGDARETLQVMIEEVKARIGPRGQRGKTTVPAEIAEGMGAVGIKVTKPGAIAPALEKAQRLNAEGKTVLLDIHTRREEKRSGK